MLSHKVKRTIITVASALALVLGGFGASVAAAPQEDHKVTICHRTDSVTNPYVQESVDVDSADGNTGNDNGQGDHSEHTGPVATSETVAQALKDNHENWGDIIPQHDNYAGLNWTAEGQAVYNNGCNYATPTTTENPGTTTTPGSVLGAGTTTNPQVVAPQGAVAAGAGGAKVYSPVAMVGMLGSFVALVTGGVLTARRRV